jgi:hypothetical protein
VQDAARDPHRQAHQVGGGLAHDLRAQPGDFLDAARQLLQRRLQLGGGRGAPRGFSLPVAGLARLARLARDLLFQLGDAAGIPPGLAAGAAGAARSRAGRVVRSGRRGPTPARHRGPLGAAQNLRQHIVRRRRPSG